MMIKKAMVIFCLSMFIINTNYYAWANGNTSPYFAGFEARNAHKIKKSSKPNLLENSSTADSQNNLQKTSTNKKLESTNYYEPTSDTKETKQTLPKNTLKQQNPTKSSKTSSKQKFIKSKISNDLIKVPIGTAVEVTTTTEIDADDIKELEPVNFIVKSPVVIEGYEVIKAGNEIRGQVINKRNNFIFGISGEIKISNFQLRGKDNVDIKLRGEISDIGKHRAWVNFGWIALVTMPVLFIKGNDGKIQPNRTFTLYTAETLYIPTEATTKL